MDSPKRVHCLCHIKLAFSSAELNQLDNLSSLFVSVQHLVAVAGKSLRTFFNLLFKQILALLFAKRKMYLGHFYNYIFIFIFSQKDD